MWGESELQHIDFSATAVLFQSVMLLGSKHRAVSALGVVLLHS
jgi:hypothetical protein